MSCRAVSKCTFFTFWDGNRRPCRLVMKWACILRIIVRVGCNVLIVARQHLLSWCDRTLAVCFRGAEQLSLFWWWSEHASCEGQCVTCAVLRAVMFCCDASSCFRSTFDIAIKSLSVLVLIGTCVFWITCMGSVQSANCCALALSVGLRVDAYLCLLWVRPIVVFLCDAVNIHAVWTVRWAHFFYW